jgi:hypothetical protein
MICSIAIKHKRYICVHAPQPFDFRFFFVINTILRRNNVRVHMNIHLEMANIPARINLQHFYLSNLSKNNYFNHICQHNDFLMVHVLVHTCISAPHAC